MVVLAAPPRARSILFNEANSDAVRLSEAFLTAADGVCELRVALPNGVGTPPIATSARRHAMPHSARANSVRRLKIPDCEEGFFFMQGVTIVRFRTTIVSGHGLAVAEPEFKSGCRRS